MSDYTEESIFATPLGTFEGRDAIRAFFEQVFAEFGARGTVFNVNDRVIAGDVAYLTWSAETSANTYSFGADSFFFRDGKIVGQTLALVMTPKA
jgi:ketosteroid isomerase-like protein